MYGRVTSKIFIPRPQQCCPFGKNIRVKYIVLVNASGNIVNARQTE